MQLIGYLTYSKKILHFVAEPSVTHPPELGTIQEERSNATSRASTAPLSADERQLPSTELHNTESESVETSDMSENAQTSDDESLRRAAVISKSESLLDLSRTASMELLIKNSEENSRSPPRRSSFDAATQTPVLTPSVTRPQFERAANIVAPVEQLQKARISKNRKSSRVRILTPPKGPPPPKPKILPNKKMEIKEQPKYLQRYLKFAKDAYKGLKSKKIKVPLDHPLFAPVKPRRHHSSRSGSSASSAVSSDNEGDSLRKKKMTLKKGSRPKLDTRYPVLPKIRTDRSYVETMRPADGGVAWPPGVAAPGATYDWNQYGFAPSYLQSQPTQSGPSNLWDQNGPDGNMAEMQQHASSWIQPQAYYAPGPAWNAYPSYQWG